jgi:hypothetical protein
MLSYYTNGNCRITLKAKRDYIWPPDGMELLQAKQDGYRQTDRVRDSG